MPTHLLLRRWQARTGGADVPLRPGGTALTGLGAVLLAMAGSLLALTTWARAPGLYPLLALLLAVVAVSWAQRARLTDLRVDGGAHLQLVRGHAATWTVTALNTGRRGLPPLQLALSAPGLGAEPVVLPALAPGGSATVGLGLVGERRGVHPVLPLTVVDTGSWGVLRRERRLVLATAVAVTPRLLDLEGAPPLAPAGYDDDAADTRGRPALRGSQPRGTRPWRPGEEARAVHWRATARAGSLTVREWDPPRSRALGLVVQVAPGTPAAGTVGPEVEELLDEVATRVAAAVADGGRVCVGHARAARPADGAPAGHVVVELVRPASVGDVLLALAGVEALRTDGLVDLAEPVLRQLGRGGTLVLALGLGWGAWTARELLEVADAADRGGCRLEVVVGAAAGPRPPGADAALAALAGRCVVRGAVPGRAAP